MSDCFDERGAGKTIAAEQRKQTNKSRLIRDIYSSRRRRRRRRAQLVYDTRLQHPSSAAAASSDLRELREPLSISRPGNSRPCRTLIQFAGRRRRAKQQTSAGNKFNIMSGRAETSGCQPFIIMQRRRRRQKSGHSLIIRGHFGCQHCFAHTTGAQKTNKPPSRAELGKAS